MANKRKYPEVSGYWVYSIKIPSINKYYIGTSKQQCSRRWVKSNYKGKSLEPYLNEWDSMVKTVLVDNLSKEEAYHYEDKIIQALSMNYLCINERRSGLVRISDVNTYMKEWRENNQEQQKQYRKEYYENNKEKVKQYYKLWYEKNKERENQRVKQWKLNKKLEQQTSLQQ